MKTIVKDLTTILIVMVAFFAIYKYGRYMHSEGYKAGYYQATHQENQDPYAYKLNH